MGRHAKLLLRILRFGSDANVAFADLCALLRNLGFAERLRGSHHIFTRPNIPERLNLQESGGDAKIYQIRQVRKLILKYDLGGLTGDE